MNYSRRTLQELTIKDNFMFGAVMMEEQNCRAFLEISLGLSIQERLWRSCCGVVECEAFFH